MDLERLKRINEEKYYSALKLQPYFHQFILMRKAIAVGIKPKLDDFDIKTIELFFEFQQTMEELDGKRNTSTSKRR